MKLKTWTLAGVCALTLLTAAGPASAQSILYRNDGVNSTDYMAQALTDYATTSTTGNLSSFTLSNYAAVVYAAQYNSAPTGDIAALTTYLANGGRVIFTNWQSTSPPLNSASIGTTNLTSFTVGPKFGAGITNPLTVSNTGYGIFSRGLAPLTGGTAEGIWSNGQAAIILGNDGRSIHNGFLTDTVASRQLYANQLASFFVAAPGAVPEPATWGMMILGFGAVGGAMRRRGKVTTRVSFA